MLKGKSSLIIDTGVTVNPSESRPFYDKGLLFSNKHGGKVSRGSLTG